MTQKVVFLDTNIFLHYLSPDQIDWRTLLVADHVVLCVAGVVIKQLQDKKDIPKSAKLRKRAAEALKRFDEWSEASPALLRPGVELRFRTKEPRIDFSQHNLSRQSEDDRLVASMLDLMKETGDTISLVTDDVGLKLAARERGFDVIRLPECAKLPEEPDDVQKEILQLRTKLSKYENRVPDLALVFANGSNRYEALLKEVSRDGLHEKANEAVQGLARAYPIEPEPEILPGQPALAAFANPLFADNVIYNRRLRKYFNDYEAYFYDREELAQRKVQLDLFVANNGNCPGENIDIVLVFPIATPVHRVSELPFPEAPSPPKSKWDINILNQFRDVNLGFVHRAVESNVTGPFIEKRENEVTKVRFHVRAAKHGLNVDLEPIVVLFNSWETACSFTVPYTMYAANVPHRVERALHVEVKTERAT